MAKILDKDKLKAEAEEAGLNANEKFLSIYESIFPLLLSAYEQGKNGEVFDVLPVKEV